MIFFETQNNNNNFERTFKNDVIMHAKKKGQVKIRAISKPSLQSRNHPLNPTTLRLRPINGPPLSLPTRNPLPPLINRLRLPPCHRIIQPQRRPNQAPLLQARAVTLAVSMAISQKIAQSGLCTPWRSNATRMSRHQP